jgi:hypothetical protein
LIESVVGIGDTIHFANGLAGNLPTTGLNVVVLQSFDNDANPGHPFGAGNAASLIADQITSPGTGFFLFTSKAAWTLLDWFTRQISATITPTSRSWLAS